MNRRLGQQRSRMTEPAGEGPVGLFAALGLALVVSRFVLPAESAHLGETLWIVPLWLGLGFVWTLARLRFEWPSVAIDRSDWAVVLLAGGHVLAGLLADGNRRAALNGVTEWIGVAVAVGLLRRWLTDERRWQQFLGVVATAGVVLSGLGVWQYAVEYPALRADVEVLGALEVQQRAGPLSELESARLRQLRLELGQLASQSDPNLRFALRQRLMRSTEPLACFALTNTLAGVLTVALLLLLGGLSSEVAGGTTWSRMARIVGPALLMGFCLLLTKSRTGWAGFGVGAAVWGILTRRGSRRSGRTLRVVSIGFLAVAGLVAGAWLAGALDGLVVLESLKSLRYRFEYWTGAWGVIREHLLLGVGPGNFRQNYLRHKVPGSSEEILDPHNLFLDAWASGGLLALLGLLLCVGLAVARWRRLARVGDGTAPGRERVDPVDRLVLLSGVAGIGLVWLKLGVVDLQWDGRLLALMGGWVASVLLLPRLRVAPAAQIAAAAALGVHLLGAGGMSMPVVSTLLLLLGLGPSATPAPVPLQPRSAYYRAIGTSVVLGGLIVVALQWAVIPSMLANFGVNAAMSVMRERGDAGMARLLLENAARDDSLDPQPHVHLAQLGFEGSRSRRNGAELAATAIKELDEAIRLDPENPKTYWLQAQWKLESLSIHGDRAPFHDVVETAEAAAARDPQNAAVLATLSLAYERTGRQADARRIATRALELDALNLQLAHYDRLLEDGERARLREIATR